MRKFYQSIETIVPNRFLFSRDLGNVWLKHEVEKVGNFEHFLPALYDYKGTVSKDYCPFVITNLEIM
ncbi:hypothetical protein GCM10027185_13840 [Spirosoma pulveris]